MDALQQVIPGDTFCTRAQALALGESDRSLRAASRAGQVVRLRHGAYARTSHVEGLDDQQRHLLLVRAAYAQQRGYVESGRLVGRSDFSWEEARLLGEFDGKITYGKLLRPGDSASKVVVREKLREDDMRATRRGMARFTWAEVQPDVAARRMARLARQHEESRRLYVRAR